MTVSPKEIGTGLDLIERKREGRAAPMACCPRCPEPTPLISTIHFAYAEFYCLECGGHFGFLSPRAEEDTPELKAHYERLRSEWDEHTAGLQIQGRVTDQEAHDVAMTWLDERRSRK